MSGYGDLGAMVFENPSRRRTRALRARSVGRMGKRGAGRMGKKLAAHKVGRGKSAKMRRANRMKYATAALSEWQAGNTEDAAKSVILATNNGSSPMKILKFGLKRLPQENHQAWKEFIKATLPFVPKRGKQVPSIASMPGVFHKGGARTAHAAQAATPSAFDAGAAAAAIGQSVLAPENIELSAVQPTAVLSGVFGDAGVFGEIEGVFGNILEEDELLAEGSEDDMKKKAMIVGAIALTAYCLKKKGII